MLTQTKRSPVYYIPGATGDMLAQEDALPTVAVFSDRDEHAHTLPGNVTLRFLLRMRKRGQE